MSQSAALALTYPAGPRTRSSMNSRAGSAAPARWRKVISAKAVIARTHGAVTAAAVDERSGHSASNAKMTRYRRVRSAPTQAAPWSCAHAIESPLQAV